MKPIIICSLLMLIGCGYKIIPYSQSTDGKVPNNAAQSHYKWGVTYAKQGNLTEAITEFKLAIQIEPGWAIPYYNLGAAYGNMGDIEQSILAWERATQLDVDFAKAYYSLAIAYSLKATEPKDDSWQIMDIEKAISSLQAAIRIDKNMRLAAKTEPAFDTIRNLPEFIELIQDIKPLH